MRPSPVARWLLVLYAALATLSALFAVGAAAHGELGSAALNALLVVLWGALWSRQRARLR